MEVNVKIVGTSFHPIPDGEYVRINRTFNFENVPCAETNALLIPEPTNEYDPMAVKVMVPLENGQAFCIGYLPKNSEHKVRIATEGKIRMAEVMIKDFSQKNPSYSASWFITEMKGNSYDGS